MLFRLLLILLSVGLVVFVVTQVMWPAIVNQPFFPLFRAETRLARAERLKAEALAEKQAAEAEAATIRLDTEAQRIRDEAFNNLVNNPPNNTPPRETRK